MQTTTRKRKLSATAATSRLVQALAADVLAICPVEQLRREQSDKALAEFWENRAGARVVRTARKGTK